MKTPFLKIQNIENRNKQTIQRYITKNPKLKASRDLQKIMYILAKTIEKTFKNSIGPLN